MTWYAAVGGVITSLVALAIVCGAAGLLYQCLTKKKREKKSRELAERRLEEGRARARVANGGLELGPGGSEQGSGGS